jgi:hypothetical protein
MSIWLINRQEWAIDWIIGRLLTGYVNGWEKHCQPLNALADSHVFSRHVASCSVLPVNKMTIFFALVYWNKGLFRKKYTLSKMYSTKTTDAKSRSCVRMERKSLEVLISMIWCDASLRLWLMLPVTCCNECGKSWIIDLTSAKSHVWLTSSACKVWK